MTNDTKPAKHGGKRAGAGRKPAHPDGAKAEICVSVTPAVAQYLADAKNRSLAVEAAVRESSDFRRWLIVARAERTLKTKPKATRGKQ